jgi:hypothetical protein
MIPPNDDIPICLLDIQHINYNYNYKGSLKLEYQEMT